MMKFKFIEMNRLPELAAAKAKSNPQPEKNISKIDLYTFKVPVDSLNEHHLSESQRPKVSEAELCGVFVPAEIT